MCRDIVEGRKEIWDAIQRARNSKRPRVPLEQVKRRIDERIAREKT